MLRVRGALVHSGRVFLIVMGVSIRCNGRSTSFYDGFTIEL